MQISCSSTDVLQGEDTLDLENFRWKNRLILIFSPSKTDTVYLRQIRELENEKKALEDRDIVVLHIFPQGGFYDTHKINQGSAKALRKNYRIAENQFMLILVGKDGGTKLKENKMTHLSQILGLIDSMPMRIQEMKTQKNKN